MPSRKILFKILAAALWGLVTLGLCLLPGPRHVTRAAADGARSARARVTAVDDSQLTTTGLLRYGSQRLKVELLDGPRAGATFDAANEIRAQLDLDKFFRVGDTAVVTIGEKAVPGQTTLVAKDYWRLGWMALLFGVFSLLLVLFGGWTGAKALFSFVFSCLVVWKALVPLSLEGCPASWVAFAVVAFLTGVIMILVAGWSRIGLTAFLGAMLGVFAGLATAHLFGALMHVNGATMPFAQALLYSGYEGLDLSDIFIGATVLACSGAVMDLAMDIAAGMAEVVRHNPHLPPREVLLSGLRIGRSVVGTMTTTLLLAYSGGYVTLLMVFAAEGTSVWDILNATLVSGEIVKTLVGSFALVLVAPFTALVGSRIL